MFASHTVNHTLAKSIHLETLVQVCSSSAELMMPLQHMKP